MGFLTFNHYDEGVANGIQIKLKTFPPLTKPLENNIVEKKVFYSRKVLNSAFFA